MCIKATLEELSFSNKKSHKYHKPIKYQKQDKLISTMAQFGGNRIYQDFEPFFEWNEDQASVSITIMLPGFRREQLKVQVTSTPVLRINGEREVTENVMRRFSKEFSIPSYCDTNNVTAKFERGTLLVNFPKIIQTPPPPPVPQEQSKTEQQEEQKVAPQIPQQKEPSSSPPSQENNNNNNDQQKVKEEEEATNGGDGKDEEKKSKEEAEPKKEAIMQSGNNNAETEKKVIRAENERKGARIAQRLKTRMLDFTLSVNADEENKDVVGQGYGGNLVTGVVKKPKILVNIVVAILLVMVLGIYVKHAFYSSSSSSSFEGGSELFQEF